MLTKKQRKSIEKLKKSYRRIKVVPCPAFSGEPVYFTSSGLKHLLFKNREYRPAHEQLRRLALIPKAVSILRNCERFHGQREYVVETKTSRGSWQIKHILWSFVRIAKNQKTTVIVRQIGSGARHFLSVMSDPKKRKPR